MDSKNVPERWLGLWAQAQLDEVKPWHFMQLSPKKVINLIEELATAERRALIAKHAYMTEMPIDTPDFKKDFQRGLDIAEQQLIEMGKITANKK